MFKSGTIADASPGFGAWIRRRNVAPAFASFADGRLGLVEAAQSTGPVLREQSLPGLAFLQAESRGGLLCLASRNLVRLRRASREADAPLSGEIVRCLEGEAASVLAILPDGRPVTADAHGALSVSAPSGSAPGIWQPGAALGPLTLTGVALDDDGSPAYATARRERTGRREGVVVDLRSGDVVVRDLGDVRSPRLENGWLWFLDQDRDALCVADPGSGLSETVVRCPGRVGGLAMAGDHAVVGVSPAPAARPRQRDVPDGIRGLLVVDTHQGRIAEWLALAGIAGTIDAVALIASKRPARSAAALRSTTGDDRFTSP